MVQDEEMILKTQETLAADKPKEIEVIKVNFTNGTIIDKVKFEEDAGIPKVLRELAKFAKKEKVKSIVLMTLNEDDHVDWVHIADSEHHMALAALTLDDIKEDLKAKIFGVQEE